MQQTENLERHFDPLEFAFLRRRHGVAICCYATHRLLWEYQDIVGLDEALPYFPAILDLYHWLFYSVEYVNLNRLDLRRKKPLAFIGNHLSMELMGFSSGNLGQNDMPCTHSHILVFR